MVAAREQAEFSSNVLSSEQVRQSYDVWRNNQVGRAVEAGIDPLDPELVGFLDQQALPAFFNLIQAEAGWDDDQKIVAMQSFGIDPFPDAPVNPEHIRRERLRGLASTMVEEGKSFTELAQQFQAMSANEQEAVLFFNESIRLDPDKGAMGALQGLGASFALLNSELLTLQPAFPAGDPKDTRAPKRPAQPIPSSSVNPDALKMKEIVNKLYGPGAFTAANTLRETYGEPRWKTVGTTTLEDAGVPAPMAEFVARDLMDPLGLAMGKPLTVLLTAGAATFAAHVARNPKSALGMLNYLKTAATLGRGVGMGDGELNAYATLMRETAEEAYGVVAKQGKPLSAAQAASIATGFTGISKKASDIFIQGMKKGSPEAIKKADDMVLEIIKQAAKEDPESVRQFLRVRLLQAQTPQQLMEIQRRYGNIVKLPEAWFSRKTLQEQFFDRKTGEIVSVDGGLYGHALRFPFMYFNEAGNFHKSIDDIMDLIARDKNLSFTEDELKFLGLSGSNKQASRISALRKQIGDNPDAMKMLQDNKQYAYLGRNPSTIEMRTALEEFNIGKSISEVEQLNALGGGPISLMARRQRQLLANVGMEDVGIAASSMARVAREARSLELFEAVGGVTRRHKLGTVGRVKTGGIGITREGVPDLLKTKDNRQALSFALGSEDDRARLNVQRLAEGLEPITEISDDVQRAADRIRPILDAMKQEAVDAGLSTPDQYLQNYIPNIRGRLAKGATIQQLVEEASRNGDAGKRAAINMVRSGDINIQEFDFLEVMKAYSTNLYRHKFIVPVANEIKELALNPNNAIGIRDKRAMFEFASRMAGETTRSDISPAMSMNKALWMNDKFGTAAEQAASGKKGLAYRWLQNIDTLGAAPVKWAQRQFTNAWVLGKLSRPGAGLKNQPQMILGASRLGAGLGVKEVKPYLAIAARDIVKNRDDFMSRYALADRKWGWSENFTEFLDEINDNFLGVITPARKRAIMSTFSGADGNSRMNLFRANELYADDLFENFAKGGKAYKAAQLKVKDQARLLRALKNGDRALAREALAEAGVNDTQWLYHNLDRPLGFNTRSEALNAGIQTVSLMTSWPINFTEEALFSAAHGAKGKSGPIGKAAGAINGSVFRFMGGMSLFGIGVDQLGEVLPGNVDADVWFLADSPTLWRKAVRSARGLEDDPNDTSVLGGGRLPIAARGIQDAFRLAKSVGTGQLDEATLLFKSIRGVSDFYGAVHDALTTSDEISQSAFENFYNSQPIPNHVVEPLGQYIYGIAGFEESEIHRNTFEKGFSAFAGQPDVLDPRAREGLAKRTARSFGIPFKDEER